MDVPLGMTPPTARDHAKIAALLAPHIRDQMKVSITKAHGRVAVVNPKAPRDDRRPIQIEGEWTHIHIHHVNHEPQADDTRGIPFQYGPVPEGYRLWIFVWPPHRLYESEEQIVAEALTEMPNDVWNTASPHYTAEMARRQAT